MFSILNDRKENKRKTEHEKQLKKALAEKCADMGSRYVSHKEDETQYTVVTINGDTLKLKKEEITIGSVTEYKLKNR